LASTLDDASLDILFLTARTHHGFTAEPVSDELLRRVHDVARMGPTSMNCCPLRVVFVRSKEGKERLLPALSPGNVEQTKAAPVTAIFAFDVEFYEKLPKLFPHKDVRGVFAGKPEVAEAMASRNATLQAAYFMLAARAHGLDCGPMAGFDKAKVDAEFLAGTTWRSLFLCNLGHGDAAKLHPRGPRLDFDEACTLA
jgi:3-hydroxypropanoate dehydrogenase